MLFNVYFVAKNACFFVFSHAFHSIIPIFNILLLKWKTIVYILKLVKLSNHFSKERKNSMDNQKWWHEKMPGGTPKKMPEFSSGGIKKAAIIIAIIALLFITVATSVYTVNDKQQAVVTTFGKVTSVTGPGMHFKLPFGIQRAEKVDVNVYRKIEIGYRTQGESDTYGYATPEYVYTAPAGSVMVEDESKMISGDYNIVNCDFFVEYKISDPVKYLYNSQQPDEILKSLAQSHIRNVISSYTVDQILTTGKGEIQTNIKENIIEELSVYDLGLVLTDIKLQDSEPPTEEVKKAFKDVETAKQERETTVNIANAYKNEQIPKAEAEADRLIAEAELAKQQRINEANAQVAEFNAVYGEYTQSPAVTKKRMFFETVEKVLPDAKVYIDTSNGSTQKLLPIDSFNN